MFITSSKQPSGGRATLLWAAFIAVCIADLGLAGLALHPAVGREYYDFFISQTSDCLPRPVDGILKTGTMATLNSASEDPGHVIYCGMGGAEDRYSWTEGHHAAFLLPVAATGDQQFALQIANALLPRSGSQQRLIFSIDGHQIGTATITEARPHNFTVPIAPDLLYGHEKVVVDILLPDAGMPHSWHSDSGNARTLGVAISAVGIVAKT